MSSLGGLSFLQITVELEQTPISPGMAKLQNMLELAISEAQAVEEQVP